MEPSIEPFSISNLDECDWVTEHAAHLSAALSSVWQLNDQLLDVHDLGIIRGQTLFVFVCKSGR